MIGVDSSAPALALAEESAAANGLRAKFVKADVFEELERLGSAKETFDIVIADPPPFVKSRKDLEPGREGVSQARALGGEIGGRPTACCCLRHARTISCRIVSRRSAPTGIARAERRARLIRQSGAGPDHPVHPMLRKARI